MIIEEHKGMKIFRSSSESTTPKNIKMISINEKDISNFLCIYKDTAFDVYNNDPMKSKGIEYYYIHLDNRDEFGLRFDDIEIARWYFEKLRENHPPQFKTKETIEKSKPNFFI